MRRLGARDGSTRSASSSARASAVSGTAGTSIALPRRADLVTQAAGWAADSRYVRRGATFTAAFLACCAGAASPAAAATQLGHTDFPVECLDSGYSVVQTAVAHGDGYAAPAGGGVITSWSIRGNDDPEAAIRLRVFRAADTAGEYVLVGEGERAELLAPNEVNSFAARVPVREGDL